MRTNPLTLRELLGVLALRGLVPAPAEERPLPAALSEANDLEATPWYVKAMIGVAGWIAAGFLLSFFGIAGLIDSATSMLLWGAIMAVAALALRRLVRTALFWHQMAFAFSLVGQGLLIVGVGMQSEDLTLTMLFTVGLELVLFFAYPDTFHRTLSVLAIGVALVGLLYDQKLLDGVHALVIALGLGTVVVWQQELRLLANRWSPYRAPLGYGLPLTLFGITLLSLVGEIDTNYWWVSAVGLALVLLYLSILLLRELGYTGLNPMTFWVVGAILITLIPAYQTPGILAALIVLCLGRWRGNGLLMGLATLFLLFFLSAYYYNLDITLLNKSYILMGTGVVLLVVHMAFMRIQRMTAPAMVEGSES